MSVNFKKIGSTFAHGFTGHRRAVTLSHTNNRNARWPNGCIARHSVYLYDVRICRRQRGRSAARGLISDGRGRGRGKSRGSYRALMVAMMLVRLSAWSPKASSPRKRVSSNHASAFSRVVARVPGPCAEHSSAIASSKG